MFKISAKGFVFTLEAGIALALFGLMIFTLPTPQSFSLKELALSQNANDLLRVWSAKETTPGEMIVDAQKMFGASSSVWAEDKKIKNGVEKRNSIATEGIIVDSMLKENKIRIVVYYD